MKELLQEGGYLNDVYFESFDGSKENSHLKRRLRPLEGQALSNDLRVECSSSIRRDNPVGTIFFANEVKVVKKSNGGYYLIARHDGIHQKVIVKTKEKE